MTIEATELYENSLNIENEVKKKIFVMQVGSMEDRMSCLMCQFCLQFGVCGQSLLFLVGS